MTATSQIDPLSPNEKKPEAWDLAAAPPDVPIGVQGKAIQKFLSEEEPMLPVELLLNEPPTPSASTLALPPILQVAAKAESAASVEEFKPTDEEWENVKEREFPRPPDALPDANEHPAYKPEVLERDAEGADDGDWHDVEPEMPKS
jgi:hypothetical protein